MINRSSLPFINLTHLTKLSLTIYKLSGTVLGIAPKMLSKEAVIENQQDTNWDSNVYRMFWEVLRGHSRNLEIKDGFMEKEKL